MAWESPKTWVDTEDRLNAANLNRYVRDNQIALRADAAALSQRVGTLEVGGFSDAMLRDVNFGTSSRGQQVLTNLTPPANTKLIYIGVRIENFSSWTAVPLIDYAIWKMFPEYEAGVTVPAAERWPFRAQGYLEQHVVGGYVFKGTGGVLGLWGGSASRDERYDQICVRWYT